MLATGIVRAIASAQPTVKVNMLASAASPPRVGHPASAEGRKAQRLFWVPVIALLAVALAALIEPLAAIPYRVSSGYNEGWNALWSDVALSGGALYPAPDAAIANNYPPLSFFLVGALGRALGDNILAGRIVSLASLAGIAGALFTWLRLSGTSRQLAGFGAAVFLAAMAGFAPGYLAFDDPQLLAHAVMLGGLVVLWRGRCSVRAVALSAAIMVIGGFIKHLLVPLPLATTLWLFVYRRGRLGAWILAGAATTVALFALSGIAFGLDFFRDLFAGRLYDLREALRETGSACAHLWPLLLLTAVAVKLWTLGTIAERQATLLVVCYAALAAAVGVAASLGDGVNVNAFFDLLIACSLGSALGVQALLPPSASRPAAVSGLPASAAGWIAAAMLVGEAAWALPAHLSAMTRFAQQERETGEDVRILARFGRGHAACEEPALCYWAGSGFTVDMFNFGQKLGTGVVPPSACETLFGAGRIAALQLKTHAAIGTRRLPEACMQVIRQHFAPIHESSNGEILIRRVGASASSAIH